MEKRILNYKKELNQNGTITISIFRNGKVMYEIYAFKNSPYSVEEEIQNFLDEINEGDDYEFVELLNN